jgi:hypothetical protein
MPSPEASGLFIFDEPQAGAPQRSQEVRNNFEAVVRANFGTDPTKPAVARDGMSRVLKDGITGVVRLQYYLNGGWRTFGQFLELGVPVGTKKIFQFTPASTPWTITHNLGSQPLVQVYDATYKQLQAVPAAPGADQYILQHSGSNVTIVTHAAPASGYAIVLG